MSETSVRWRIYKCHLDLKELEEALTVVSFQLECNYIRNSVYSNYVR